MGEYCAEEGFLSLSVMLNYTIGFAESTQRAIELEKIRLDFAMVAEGYNFDASRFTVAGNKDRAGHDRLGHPADRQPHTDIDRNDGGWHRCAFRRAVSPRAGWLRS
jgi:hypothetical protein